MHRIIFPVDYAFSSFVLREDTGGGMADVVNAVVDNSGYGDKRYWPAAGIVGVSIFDELEDTFNTASTNNTYQFQAVSSAQDTFGRRDFRVKLVRTAGSDDFEFGGSGAQLLGATSSANVAHTAGEVVMPDSYAGSFIVPEEMEWDSRVYPSRFNKALLRNDKGVMITQRNVGNRIRLKYFKVPGALVFSDRAADVITDFRTEANINSTDDYATLEHFWEDCILNGYPFMFVRHGLESSIEYNDNSSQKFYIVTDENVIADMENMLTDIVDSMGKDYYHIEFQAVEQTGLPLVLP